MSSPLPSLLAAGELESNVQAVADLKYLLYKQDKIVDKVLQSSIEYSTRGKNAELSKFKQSTKPEEMPSGCRARLWKQDPSVKEVPIRTVFLPGIVSEGPRDANIAIDFKNDKKITSPVKADENGDMLIEFEKDNFAFDVVHTFAVVRLVLDMFSRDIGRSWRWQWDDGKSDPTPINIICHAGVKQNAAYLRSKKLMKFYFFTDENTKKDVYLCRSLDIVAHETGHACLDALKPKLYYIKKGQPGALHEAFADLTTIFTILSQFDLCEDIIANTKANLRSNRYLSAIGEQMAKAIDGPSDESGDTSGEPDEPGETHNSSGRGMRDCNNELKGTEVKPTQIYELATVFSGYIFDILVDVFEHERNPNFVDDAKTLYQVARILRRCFLKAVVMSPPVPNFMDISLALETAVTLVAEEERFDSSFWNVKVRYHRMRRELSEAGKEEKELDLGDF